MRILIVKLSSIGDVVNTLPALSALRRGFSKARPRVEIDWLVEQAASGVLAGHPFIDNVIVVKNRGWTKGLKENLKTARFIASRQYDMVLDFQGLLKSAIWVKLSKGKRRIGFSNSREMSHIFLNEKLPPYNPEMHAVERYLSLAKHAGGVTGACADPLQINRAETKNARKLLEKEGLPAGGKKGFFLLAPRARWATKLWSDDGFAEAAREISGRWGLSAVIIGGTRDRAELDRMRSAIGDGAINLCGKTDLRTLAAVTKAARFVLTVDSGPMHIAAAALTPVVALFGPTAPWRTGPYGVECRIVRKDLSCSPCFRRTCQDPRCMREITAADVVGAVTSLLSDCG